MEAIEKRKLWNNNILFTAVVIAIVLIIPLFSLVSIEQIVETYKENTEYTVKEYTKQTATVISRELSNEIDSLNIQRDQLCLLNSSDYEAMEKIMNNRAYDGIRVLFVGDKMFPENYNRDKFSGFSQSYFYLDSGIVEPYISGEGDACFGMYTIVPFSDGIRGYLYEEIRVEDARNTYISFSYSDLSSSYVISRGGDILCYSENAYMDSNTASLFQLLKDGTGKKNKDRDKLNKVINDVVDGKIAIDEFSLNETDSLFCFVPIEGSSWTIVSVIPTQIMASQLNKVIGDTFRLIIALIATVILLAAVFFYRRLKKEKITEEKYSGEKKMMVSAVSETHSAGVEIDLTTGRVTALFSDNRLGIDFEKFEYYDDLEKIILSLTRSRYTELMNESFTLKTLQRILNENNRNIYAEAEFTIKGENHWVAVDVTLADPIKKQALYMIRFIDNEKNEEIRKREALSSALDSAEKANAAKTTFLNSISHNVKTPMNGIIGMTEIAKANITDTARVEDCLDKISDSGKKLLQLINNILEVAKMESEESHLIESDFDLGDLLQKAVTDTQKAAQAREHEVITENLNIVHRKVYGDSHKLLQVWENIINNAIMYTPKGGKIKLTLLEKEVFGKDCIEYEFICEDNGIGMKPDFMKKIFNPFERADDELVKATDGSGLGLVMSRNIVRMMAGDIKVESSYKMGSKFMVYFRLRYSDVPGKSDITTQNKEEADNSDKEAESGAVKDYSDKRILLTEDNELNREIALEILNMTGVKVECAEDGSEAVDMFEDHEPYYYDLILMDINMPVMDGHEATRTIRSMDRADAGEIPIVAMSANAFLEDMASSRKAGMNDHVAKPISVPKLFKIMETYL